MNIKEHLAAVLVISLSVFLAQGLTLGVASLFPRPEAPQHLGSSSDNTLPSYPTTIGRAFVGSSDTSVVGSSTARQYLAISNASGATTTPQLVTCNFGDRAATLYSGFSIAPSTTVVFNLDNL